jgi:hypothetical protein
MQVYFSAAMAVASIAVIALSVSNRAPPSELLRLPLVLLAVGLLISSLTDLTSLEGRAEQFSRAIQLSLMVGSGVLLFVRRKAFARLELTGSQPATPPN